MQLEYDLNVGALYIRLSDQPIESTREAGDNASIDLARDGSVVGIEVISVTASWPLAEIVSMYPISKADTAQLFAYFTLAAPPTPVMVAEATAPSAAPVMIAA